MIHISNPIPATLSRYQIELQETLARIGVESSSLNARPIEGGTSRIDKIALLAGALLNTQRQARQRDTHVIHLWPSLGTLEAILWQLRLPRAKATLIYHDPIPIRKQVGFDKVSKKLTSLLARRPDLRILTHSNEARKESEKLFPHLRVDKTLHPIKTSQSLVRSSTKKQTNSILVAGQYKPERDVELLKELASYLNQSDWEMKIVGRGWPEVDGWSVEDRFIDEDEFDEMLAESKFVLIPYKKYFQSGVAIRALENGTLPILPQTSFSESLLGESGRRLGYLRSQGGKNLAEAIINLSTDGDLAGKIFDAYQKRCDESWRNLLASAE